MSELTFAWDPAKNASNRRKHGVSFEEAQAVFSDDNALLVEDPDHSLDEDRFLLLGISSVLRLLVVCHCVRPSGSDEPDVIRIISARKANPSERNQYAESLIP